MQNRSTEVLTIILNIFIDLNTSPGQTQPLRTIWERAMKYNLTTADEFNMAVDVAVKDGLLTLTSQINITLTEAGYHKSRNLN